MKIMLVEDNALVAQIFADMILASSESGTEVSLITRADDAVFHAMMQDWDLIIMDIGLDRSGQEDDGRPLPSAFDGTLAALAIRGLGKLYPSRAAVPILAVSGGFHRTDDKLFEAAGFAGGAPLMKPILPETLRDAIATYRRR